jgi:paraquat-inducible protein A
LVEAGQSVEKGGSSLVDCHDCGLRQRMGVLPRRAVARCSRCGAALRVHTSLDACLALALTGLVLLMLASSMPFMSLQRAGYTAQAHFESGALTLGNDGLWPLEVLILLLTVVFPAVKLGGTAYVLLGLKLRRPPRYLVPALRWLDQLHPWSMVEVYMLGFFVAYVRLKDSATIQLSTAVYALAALMLVMAAMDAFVDFDDIWEAVERRGLVKVPPPTPGLPLVRCTTCNLLASWHGRPAPCPRCGARIYPRKRGSFTRCWALVAAAAILYLPANLFPIMTVKSFGSGEPDTILSGVRHLIRANELPLALLVLFASILVPVLKITGLSLLLLTSQRRSRWRLRDRTRLYRVIDVIGRWSMIDIFMLSILVTMVRFGFIATVEPDAGAVAFAAVVVLTMFASMAFDPRLMWDRAGENR